MNKINIEEILEKNNCHPKSMKKIAISDGNKGTQFERIQSSIKEIVEAVIDKCAEEVTIKEYPLAPECNEVDKESILKVKQMIDYEDKK